jgi:hypothetical protein
MKRIKTYIKRPVVIKALEYTGVECLQDVGEFCGQRADLVNEQLIIRTLEGDMKVSTGDFIIQGIKGEFYPCKPDIFMVTYEEVNK